MSENLFKVVFKGEIGFDFDEDEVKANLQKFSGFSMDKIERLFAGGAHVLKKNAELDAANRFRDALMRLGALVEVEPMQAPSPPMPERPRTVAPARRAVPDFKCPACGQAQVKGQTCVACGIFFEKYEAAQKRKAEELQQSMFGVSNEADEVSVKAGPAFSQLDTRARLALAGLAVGIGVSLLQGYFFGRHLELIGFIILTTILLLVLLFSSVFSDHDLLDGFGNNLAVEMEPYLRIDRRQEWWPRKVTYTLVVLGALLYYGLVIHLSPGMVADNLAFFPGRPAAWNVIPGVLLSPLLHVRSGQLWGSLLFLWALGMALEPRLGSLRFGLLYFGLAVVAGGLGSLLHLLLFGSLPHGFGPVGAIAGLFGFCLTGGIGPILTFSLPLLGALPLVYPLGFAVRFNTLALLAFFLYAGLGGGFAIEHSFRAAFGWQLVPLVGLCSGMLAGYFFPVQEGDSLAENRRR
ncbi:hypothetical protein JCM30471_09500 [Desulfuromonas carbonis]|uniref:rhomboid family intramembrane serine protease n=1 Tax=Desulfuromonas sp. DDH964 TaxID=1823759 RepID=UPI00078B8483|nr:rhomboid family intramembrane serine protease [Desulfuromonas sp. DDH964]AMV72435.1 rhomboid family intramembrane serine protease [Desulfuromonas sp. DDH964]